MSRIASIIIPVLLLVAICPSSANELPVVQYYIITDLGPLAPDPTISNPADYFPDATAYGVNDRGEVVGYSSGGEVQPDPNYVPAEVQHATLWLDEDRYGLTAGPNAMNPDLFQFSRARDVNAACTSTGYTWEYFGPLTGYGPSRGFVWSPFDGMTVVENTIAPGRDLYLWAINDRNQAVGYAWAESTANRHAVSWRADTGLVDIGNLGFAYSKAYDINNRGEIVGESYEVSPWAGIGGPSRAFLSLPEPAYGMSAGMHSIDTWSNPDPAAYQDSSARAVNEKGQVLAWLEWQTAIYDYTHVGLWLPESDYGLPAGWTRIGSFLGDETTTFPWDLNDYGEIVGKTAVGTDPWGVTIFTAFHWYNGQWTELEQLLLPADQAIWDLDTATATTNAGQIVGWGYIAGEGLHPHAFLLEPYPARILFSDGFESGDPSAWSFIYP